MSTEVRNWDVVAKALEAAGATSSQMYIRAKALAEGKLDPMPTSFPEAPYSISAVAGWGLTYRLWKFYSVPFGALFFYGLSNWSAFDFSHET